MTLALTAIAAVVLTASGYYIECAIFPWGKCGKCKGGGKHMSPAGKHWRPCRRCKGTGRRLRVGRRVWNFIQRRRQAGQ